MHRAADDGLGLVTLGGDHGVEALLAGGDPAITTDMVQIVRPLHHELGHDRVVVVVLRDVAVGALLGLVATWQVGIRVERSPGLRVAGRPASDGVRNVGAECDPRHPLGRDGLLLDVNRLAVDIVRADVDGARGPRRVDPVLGDVAVAGQHEDVIAKGLEVIGDVIPRDVAGVVQLRHLHVGLLRQVAAVATWIPGRVARDAADIAVGVGAGVLVRRAVGPQGNVAPGHLVIGVEANRLGQPRLLVVVPAGRIEGVNRLDDFPGNLGVHHRVLDQNVAALLESLLTEWGPERRKVQTAIGRSRTRGPQGGSL